MEVEQTARAGQSVDGAGVERDRWQTMQRPRRLRRATGFTQRPPNGSRFSVLNEDVGDVEQQYRAEGVGEGSAGDGSNKIVQGESRLKERKGQGSLAKKSAAPPRASSERRSTKEGQVDMATTRMKERDGGGVSRGPDYILPLQRHRSVVFVEKENLNPGDLNSRGRGKAEMAKGKENWGGILIWNVRGAASKGVAAVVRDMKRRYRVDVVAILEPRISGNQATKVIRSWGFGHSYRVEADGFSGGIWLLWESDCLRVDIILKDEQFIHCRLGLDRKELLFTAIYASPNEHRRCSIWEKLGSLAKEIEEPWLLGGDFNEIKTPLEQKGGGRVNDTRCP
ncbi:hypothetical protein K1719_017068 [Acacia pycnantha]|nr:hypothetical protein K1719_017068 [Acacia pycnantha]